MLGINKCVRVIVIAITTALDYLYQNQSGQYRLIFNFSKTITYK